MVISIDKHTSHEVSELMCIKCGKRWIGVFNSLLKEIECPSCSVTGWIVKTGQTLPDVDEERDNDPRYKSMVKMWGEDCAKKKYREFISCSDEEES